MIELQRNVFLEHTISSGNVRIEFCGHDQFQPLIVHLPDLKVIRRIQIEQRNGLRWAAHIQRVRLQGFDSQPCRLFRSIRVNFNTVSVGPSSFEQNAGTPRDLPETDRPPRTRRRMLRTF